MGSTITKELAVKMCMGTAYASMARVEYPAKVIDWDDATAFFLAGYEYAKKTERETQKACNG